MPQRGYFVSHSSFSLFPILLYCQFKDKSRIFCKVYIVRYNWYCWLIPAPEINISPVPDIMSSSWHSVPVTRNSCRSSAYDILLKFGRSLWLAENESCRSHMKSCLTVTDDRRLFHALKVVIHITNFVES